jgi:8-oxo-dGTP pyrophosphatase MutT (NUDIX family)
MNTTSKKHSNSHDDKRPEPVTSYGVININITEPLNHYTPLILKAFEQSASDVDITTIVDINNDEFKLLKDLVSESILFLLISRKHSLGFVEFIRGRYDINDDKSIRHLFVQMTENEIREIFTIQFDILWNSMWKKNAKKTTYHKEYIVAKDKHGKIIQKYKMKNFKPRFPVREWGFPKGRKNSNEANISCAIRECCEETSLFKSEISVLPGILPLTEIMVGTNMVQYKHVYYLSLMSCTRALDMYSDELQFVEIDTAGWFKKERVINLIRPYHTEKIKIINQIINFIAYAIYCAQNDQHDENDEKV